MKHLPFLCLALSLYNTALGTVSDAFGWSTIGIPESVIHVGQQGAFSKGTLLLAGGVDSNGQPSSNIYALEIGSNGDFELVSEYSWDQPLGRFKSTYTNDGLYLAGLNAQPSNEIFRIFHENGQIMTEALKSMPVTVEVIGLGFIDAVLCVFGLDSKAGQNVLLTLETGDPRAVWQVDNRFPGQTLSQAAIGTNYGMLHVFGGIRATDGSAIDVCYGWRPKPIDGTRQKGWFELSPLPVSLTESTAFVTGQSHIGLLGKTGEFEAETASLLVYHSITDTWTGFNAVTSESINGSPVRVNDTYLFTGGGQSHAPVLLMKKQVGKLQAPDYGVMFLYFLILAAIGFFFARKQKSAAIFSIGGGNIAWWAAAISMFATGASAVSFMAIPSQVFRTNIIWLLPALVFIPFFFVQAYLLYPLLRRLNIVSTYEYLQRRFHPSLRMLASFQCIAFQTFGRISVVILLPALAISAVTGLDAWISVLLMGIVTTLYTTFGGFEAVVWTDVLQGLLMIGGIGLMIAFGISGMEGGFSEFVRVGQQYSKFDFYLSGWDITIALSSFLILRQLSEAFAMTADQPMIQRVFSTPLHKMRQFSALFCFFAILIAALVQFMGLAIFGYFHANPEQLDPFMSNDQIVPLFVAQTLPAGVSGLIIGALFAASMSSLSSSVNSVSTLIAEDFYCKFIKNVSDQKKLLVMKTASLLIGSFGTATALFLASLEIKSIFQVWFEISALIGGGFVGMFFLGMFTEKANSAGVFIGAVFSVIILLMVKTYTPVHWSLYQVIAILSCVIVGYTASLFTPSNKTDLSGLTVFTSAKQPL